jgi:DNA polymerase III subunit epsilon
METCLLLVHSPLVGASTWEPVAESLADDGYAVILPDLVGTLTTGPPYHRRQACLIADSAGGRPAVLVGHSGAGPLLATAGTMLGAGARGYVFVDAGLPTPGRSWMQTVPPGLAAQLRAMADSEGWLPPWSQWWGDEEMAILLPDPVLRERFASECPRLPLALFEETHPPAPNWPNAPGGYLQLSEAYEADAAAARELSWPVMQHRSHHLALLTNPDVVAGEMLRLIANEVQNHKQLLFYNGEIFPKLETAARFPAGHAMSLDFTAVDFQTASSHPGSVCSVGLVRIRDGQVAGKSGGLVRPPDGLGEFTDFQTSLHGITAEMVATAPPWRKVAAWIDEYVGSDVLVCHNATFTIGALRNACAADSVPLPTADFLCTMLLARQVFRLPSYRLPFVADTCGVELSGRHQVLINARGAALVAVALARQHGAGTPGELAEALGIRLGRLEPGRYVPAIRGAPRISRGCPPALDRSPDQQPDHPLHGRVIVFTGALKTRTRQQAWSDVATVGAIPEKDVTRRTNVLVIGDLNPAVLTPGATISGKAAHAFALQAKGQDIEVMSEEDFLRSL